MNNELIDRHLDAILRASGSALRNYSMQKIIEAMRAALMAAINDSALTQQAEAEPVAWILTGTDRDLVPRRYLLFSGREAELHVAQNLAGGEWQSCAAKPLYLHPPKPAAQPQPEPFPMQVTDGGRNELYEGLFDDETARERDDRLRRARAAQPVTMASRVADALEAANWSGVTSGNQCLILSAIDHLRAAQPQVPEGWDAEAYKSACDGLEYWKKQAEESELALERIRHDLSPTHMGEPVIPQWAGWACQYPGKLPRLYGAREIAEANCDRENGDTLIYLQSSAAKEES